MSTGSTGWWARAGGMRQRKTGKPPRQTLSTAVSLWRGLSRSPKLADWPPACAEAARLQEERGCVAEEPQTLNSARGCHTELVASLENIVMEEPLRERRWALLMLALYRCGRQAEALRAFQRARTALADLGLEPGPELARAERNVSLHLDSPPVELNETGGFTVPCPAAIRAEPSYAFVGRVGRVPSLREAGVRAQQGERLAVRSGGESGEGKTCLAFELARVCAADGGAVLRARVTPNWPCRTSRGCTCWTTSCGRCLAEVVASLSDELRRRVASRASPRPKAAE